MNLVRRASVFVWAGLLLVPVMQMAFRVVPEAPIQENRVLAQFPGWTAEGLLSPGTWGMKFHAWFNDNFGFRNTLIRLINQADYLLWYSDRVHLGRDGWLHYRLVLDDGKPKLARLPPEEISAIAERVEAMRAFLASRGLRLMAVTIPQKDVIYPETLRYDAPVLPRPSSFDRLRAALSARLGQDHIDGQEIMEDLKRRGVQVFHRTDFHWTDVAGGEVGRVLVNRIADLEGRPDLRWVEPLKALPLDNWSGGEAQFMPLLRPLTENTTRLESWNDPARGSFEWLGTDQHFNQAFPWAYSFVWRSSQSERTLPAAIMATNSYGDSFWRAGMHFHFRRIQVQRFRGAKPASFMAETINTVLPDTKYFVIQFHELHMPNAGLVDWATVR